MKSNRETRFHLEYLQYNPLIQSRNQAYGFNKHWLLLKSKHLKHIQIRTDIRNPGQNQQNAVISVLLFSSFFFFKLNSVFFFKLHNNNVDLWSLKKKGF